MSLLVEELSANGGYLGRAWQGEQVSYLFQDMNNSKLSMSPCMVPWSPPMCIQATLTGLCFCI